MSENTPEVLSLTTAGFLAIPQLSGLLSSFSSWVAIVCGLVILVLLFDSTDIPYIKRLPSAPGLPIVGNLIQLGSEQPRRLAELSKQYGPVYQIRLGNKVSPKNLDSNLGERILNDPVQALCCCQHLRIGQATLDQQSIQSHIPADIAHISQRAFIFTRLYDRHLSMG